MNQPAASFLEQLQQLPGKRKQPFRIKPIDRVEFIDNTCLVYGLDGQVFKVLPWSEGLHYIPIELKRKKSCSPTKTFLNLSYFSEFKTVLGIPPYLLDLAYWKFIDYSFVMLQLASRNPYAAKLLRDNPILYWFVVLKGIREKCPVKLNFEEVFYLKQSQLVRLLLKEPVDESQLKPMARQLQRIIPGYLLRYDVDKIMMYLQAGDTVRKKLAHWRIASETVPYFMHGAETLMKVGLIQCGPDVLLNPNDRYVQRVLTQQGKTNRQDPQALHLILNEIYSLTEIILELAKINQTETEARTFLNRVRSVKGIRTYYDRLMNHYNQQVLNQANEFERQRQLAEGGHTPIQRIMKLPCPAYIIPIETREELAAECNFIMHPLALSPTQLRDVTLDNCQFYRILAPSRIMLEIYRSRLFWDYQERLKNKELHEPERATADKLFWVEFHKERRRFYYPELVFLYVWRWLKDITIEFTPQGWAVVEPPKY